VNDVSFVVLSRVTASVVHSPPRARLRLKSEIDVSVKRLIYGAVFSLAHAFDFESGCAVEQTTGPRP
jgi:hypothetical protein